MTDTDDRYSVPALAARIRALGVTEARAHELAEEAAECIADCCNEPGEPEEYLGRFLAEATKTEVTS